MQQLVKRVLPVGARLTPVNRARLHADPLSLKGHVLAVALHRQLLQVSRETTEVFRIGQHGHGVRTEKIVVPDRDQRHQHRQVALERGLAEMRVHGMEAGQHLAEVGGTHRDHRGQANRRIHRIAATDPIPETEHVVGIDAELAHAIGVRRHRHEVLRDRGFITQRIHAPDARSVGVGECFLGREGLRANDEQRFGGVEIAGSLNEIAGIDIGYKAHLQVTLRVSAQCLVRHHRPQV